jgi:acyl dehydratase
MKYFDDYELGDIQDSSQRHIVTEEEIIEFGTRWDYQPFHVDPEAAKDSLFGGLVASSTHLFSIAVSLWCHPNVKDEDRAAAISALGFNNMKLKSPARPGDELKARATVIEKRLSKSNSAAGILAMQNEITNQRDELVFVYEHAGLYLKRTLNPDVP